MNTIDLFSGPGGLSIGLKRAGYQILANVELNRDAMDTYASHDSDATHYNVDVREVSFEKFRGSEHQGQVLQNSMVYSSNSR